MIFFIVVLILAILYSIIIYNGLVRKRNAIDQAYYSIDVMLKKRYELIPMLIKTVGGYMAHERNTLSELSIIRTNVLDGNLKVDNKVDSDNAINQRIGKIMIIAENYPSLKASDSFTHLQGALNESEDQLAASRRYMNAAVADYQNAIHQFPGNIVASLMGFRDRNYFKIKEEEKEKTQILF